MSRPPLPPFTEETAREKVRLAEDGWNTRDAAKVVLAYTADTKWRVRRHGFWGQWRSKLRESLAHLIGLI
uniref:DUF1348 family protein n=1 Tax=uncultured Tateyamaria sp. TaxID=455651 RepID=UPI00260ED1F4